MKYTLIAIVITLVAFQLPNPWWWLLGGYAVLFASAAVIGWREGGRSQQRRG